MKQDKLKIAIWLTPFFWGGGSELIKIFAMSLIEEDENKVEVYLLIGKNRFEFITNFLTKLEKTVKRIFKKNINSSSALNTKQMLDYFQDIPDLKLINYKNSFDNKGLIKALAKIEADVLLPSPLPLDNRFPIPWIGYIADFQHRYLKQFFSKEEMKARDKLFSALSESADTIIVNAKAVKKDAETFCVNKKAKIFSLPFTPICEDKWLLRKKPHLLIKYNLPKKYFIISNQFWVHKSHLTAFKALSLISNNDIHLVCTGNLADFRFPEYVNDLKKQIIDLGLEQRIHLLGHIPKDDQIEIMKNSLAVIQPTLFEGGPGGGSVYNAVALGIPAIVSDIPVNLELTGKNIFFFKNKNAKNLADKMVFVLNHNIERPTTENLLSNKKITPTFYEKRTIESNTLRYRPF